MPHCTGMHMHAGTFCAGADLKERKDHQPADIIRFGDSVRTIIGGLAALPVPVLAALDGAALGGGAELALAADVRTISHRASMGFPETGLGIIPGVGGMIALRWAGHDSNCPSQDVHKASELIGEVLMRAVCCVGVAGLYMQRCAQVGKH